MRFSKFGQRYTQNSGILQLMDDLGEAVASDTPVNMLGGGNPADIEAVNQVYRQQLHHLGDRLIESLANYSKPQGDKEFIDALVAFFNRHYGWNISARNIALTNGSQNAFFYLFNLFAGHYNDGSSKKILLPLVPEYIGYSDTQVEGSFFQTIKPAIDTTTYTTTQAETLEGFFKYRIDFDQLAKVDFSQIGAICCSRPTNPTGNVLTDTEIAQLDALASQHNIPLIIDNAYGLPFPNLLFTEASLTWNEHTILCLSLSKVGMPGLRTGIVVGNADVIDAISSLNAIINLAPVRIGATLATDLIHSDQLKDLSDTVINPYYHDRMETAIQLLQQELGDYPLKIHQPEGAMFLWLWFDKLPVSTTELYQQLKQAGTIVVPGEYFFPGIEDIANYQHAHQCIRMSYAQPDDILQQGIADIGRIARSLYDAA